MRGQPTITPCPCLLSSLFPMCSCHVARSQFSCGDRHDTPNCTSTDHLDAMLFVNIAAPLSLRSAALLLGAKSAVGTDTDPLAVRAAAANAALNGMEQRFQLLQCGASLSDPDPMLQVGLVQCLS